MGCMVNRRRGSSRVETNNNRIGSGRGGGRGSGYYDKNTYNIYGAKKDPHEWVNEAWLGLGNTKKIKTENPLKRSDEDIENPGLIELRLMKDPHYFSFAAKQLLNVTTLPMQSVILQELWEKAFPMYLGSRGFGKTFLMALYATLKCALVPGTKVVIVGSAFRQSKLVFEYMETIWHNAPVLRSIADNNSGPHRDTDRCTMRINDSWAIAVPLGTGERIRGLRAHTIIADEFDAISPNIYESVISGFTSVVPSPVEGVQNAFRRKALKELGVWNETEELNYQDKAGNQSIIAGTAGYGFKHFAEYHRKYTKIIKSKGDPDKLKDIFPNGVDKHFNWKDYSIIRIPYELIPEGFMDDKQISRARATVHSAIFDMEYGCVFASDSDGFFKRSLIESCVVSDKNSINYAMSGEAVFDATIRGNPMSEYVYGVDPASEVDNFSIVIIELREDHNRIVYSWTTNRKAFNKKLKAGLTDQYDFYGFCTRKIRDLMKTFPPRRIALDAQGGGIAIIEALHDPDKMIGGERTIWPTIDDNKPKDTDIEEGLHIVEMCQFANYEWLGTANHGLRKDFEDKALIFPRFDSLSLGMANEEDKTRAMVLKHAHPELKEDIDNYSVENHESRLYDSVEDCILEIEELKDELATIVITVTGTGVNSRERWDTPEIKKENGKKGRLRKDRYSSLLMANAVARGLKRQRAAVEYDIIGGFTNELVMKDKSVKAYNGPDWYTSQVGNGGFLGGIGGKQ